MVVVIGHLGVFDPMGAARQTHRRVVAQPAHRLQQRRADRMHGVVTDRMEPRLDAGQRAGNQVVGDLLIGQVPGTAVPGSSS